MTDEQKQKCHKIADHYGEQHQMLKAVEEMAELTQIIMKNETDEEGKYLCDYIQELADVIIMIEQLEYILNTEYNYLCQSALKSQITAKLNRQLKRMEDEANA